MTTGLTPANGPLIMTRHTGSHLAVRTNFGSVDYHGTFVGLGFERRLGSFEVAANARTEAVVWGNMWGEGTIHWGKDSSASQEISHVIMLTSLLLSRDALVYPYYINSLIVQQHN